MAKWSPFVPPSLALLAAAFASAGCAPGTNQGMSGEPGAPSGVKPIMTKAFGKGPDALWPKIKQGLEASPPAWEDLQPRTKELADLAAAVDKSDPPKGKESWEKDAKDFAAAAADLDGAAHAKDLDNARAAETKVGGSCQSCHSAHRNRPGG